MATSPDYSPVCSPDTSGQPATSLDSLGPIPIGLGAAADLFCAAKAAEGASPRTVEWYQMILIRALSACQRAIPLPPRGIPASVACARFGVIYGARCVQSCWAMMFLMAAGVGAHLPATLLISSVIVGERKVQRLRPMPLPVGLAFGIAVLMVMFAGDDPSTTTVPWLCRFPRA